MASFAYTGRIQSGERVSGERSAETIQDAVSALRREGIFVTRVGPARPAPAKTLAAAGRRVKARNLAAFTRQFAVMIDAGLPLVECLDLLGAEEPIAGWRGRFGRPGQTWSVGPRSPTR